MKWLGLYKCVNSYFFCSRCVVFHYFPNFKHRFSLNISSTSLCRFFALVTLGIFFYFREVMPMKLCHIYIYIYIRFIVTVVYTKQSTLTGISFSVYMSHTIRFWAINFQLNHYSNDLY